MEETTPAIAANSLYTWWRTYTRNKDKNDEVVKAIVNLQKDSLLAELVVATKACTCNLTVTQINHVIALAQQLKAVYHNTKAQKVDKCLAKLEFFKKDNLAKARNIYEAKLEIQYLCTWYTEHTTGHSTLDWKKWYNSRRTEYIRRLHYAAKNYESIISDAEREVLYKFAHRLYYSYKVPTKTKYLCKETMTLLNMYRSLRHF